MKGADVTHRQKMTTSLVTSILYLTPLY